MRHSAAGQRTQLKRPWMTTTAAHSPNRPAMPAASSSSKTGSTAPNAHGERTTRTRSRTSMPARRTDTTPGRADDFALDRLTIKGKIGGAWAGGERAARDGRQPATKTGSSLPAACELLEAANVSGGATGDDAP